MKHRIAPEVLLWAAIVGVCPHQCLALVPTPSLAIPSMVVGRAPPPPPHSITVRDTPSAVAAAIAKRDPDRVTVDRLYQDAKFQTVDEGYGFFEGMRFEINTVWGVWERCNDPTAEEPDPCGSIMRKEAACVDGGRCAKTACGVRGIAELGTTTCEPSQTCFEEVLPYAVLNTMVGCANTISGSSFAIRTFYASPTTKGASSSQSSSSTSKGTSSASSSSTTTTGSDGTFTGASGNPTGSVVSEGVATPSNNTGIIVGGVLGGLGLLCASGLAALFIIRRGKKREQAKSLIPGDSDSHDAITDTKGQAGWGPSELSSVAPPTELQTQEKPVELPSKEPPVELPEKPYRHSSTSWK